MFFGTQLAILITYVPLNWLYELVFPPKETKAMDVNMTQEEQEAAKAAQAKAEAIENAGQPAIDLENAEKNSNTSEAPAQAPPVEEPVHE
jgi:hypothetical protein